MEPHKRSVHVYCCDMKQKFNCTVAKGRRLQIFLTRIDPQDNSLVHKKIVNRSALLIVCIWLPTCQEFLKSLIIVKYSMFWFSFADGWRINPKTLKLYQV